MTKYQVWLEGYRGNENSITIEADDASEAAEKLATDDFWMNDSENRKAYMQALGKGKTIFVQEDDMVKMFNVTGEATVEFWVDEI